MALARDPYEHLPQKTFAGGEDVLAEGAHAGVLYILASGSVEIVKAEVQITTVAEPGSIFGEVSILLAAPHMASVRTLEASTFHIATDPLAFLRSHPAVALELARLLARRLHSVTSYLVDLKRQFADSGDHLSMVDEVLESLVHHQEAEATTGSDRHPDTKLD